eukprot:307335-Pelagomonas_calceolata.AAC.1
MSKLKCNSQPNCPAQRQAQKDVLASRCKHGGSPWCVRWRHIPIKGRLRHFTFCQFFFSRDTKKLTAYITLPARGGTWGCGTEGTDVQRAFKDKGSLLPKGCRRTDKNKTMKFAFTMLVCSGDNRVANLSETKF